MLTTEQIKNLKPGDPVVLRGEFQSVDADGVFWIKIGNCHRWYSISCVSRTSEIVNSQSSIVNKYDPTRLFKKGDKVKPRSGKTVLASEYGFVTFHELAGEYEVNEDEARGTVTLIVNGHACFVSAFALELVTPVEELIPYSVLETDTIDGFDIMRDGLCVMTFPYGSKEAGYYRNKLAAKEAAEAECDRLNEEWRKEQQ